MADYIRLPAGTEDIETIVCTVWVSGQNRYLTDSRQLEKQITDYILKELHKAGVSAVGLLPSMLGVGGDSGIVGTLMTNIKIVAEHSGYIKGLIVGLRLSRVVIRNEYIRRLRKHQTTVDIRLGIRYKGAIPDTYDRAVGARLFEMEVLCESLIIRLRQEYPQYIFTSAVSIFLKRLEYSFFMRLPLRISHFTRWKIRRRLLREKLHESTDISYIKKWLRFKRISKPFVEY